MLPILKFTFDEKEHHIKELIDYISNLFQLDEEERKRKLPSGYDTIINNRVGWARTYLKKAELLVYTQKGYFKITDRGLTVLHEKPLKINIKYLKCFSEFLEFNKPSKKIDQPKGKEIELILEEKTPEELL